MGINRALLLPRAKTLMMDRAQSSVAVFFLRWRFYITLNFEPANKGALKIRNK